MMKRFILSTCMILAVGIFTVAPAFAPIVLSAQTSEVTTEKSFDIPYQYVEEWSKRQDFSFPTSVRQLSSLQIFALQYFLKSQNLIVTTDGTLNNSTYQALFTYQNGTKNTLLSETKKSINNFFSQLYCPVGKNDMSTADFRLDNVNKERILPNKYTPNDLVLASDGLIPYASPICVESETYDHFVEMYIAAKADGVPLYVTSSYRGEESQNYLLRVTLRSMGNSAYRIVALPGKSEHNLGTALDLAGVAPNGTKISVSAGPQFAWLKKHAAEYGFVNSYQAGKEDVTGFLPEPWHWRYVGAPIATQVTKKGITFAEFINSYQDKIIKNITPSQNRFSGLLSKVVVIGG